MASGRWRTVGMIGVAVSIGAACGGGEGDAASSAVVTSIVLTTLAPADVSETSTTPSATTVAAAAQTTAIPTTAPVETTTTTAATTTVAATTTSLALAPCVDGELWSGMEGRRGEVALYQTTLAARGFDPGEIDGYFGALTLEAAYAEIMANGVGADDDGVFQEWFPDDGAVLEPAFVRLGIACT